MSHQILIEDVEAAVSRALAKHTPQTTPWYNTEKAAEYIGCTAGTLKFWRSAGEGPNYHVIQKKLIRYHIDDLDAFVRGEVER